MLQRHQLHETHVKSSEDYDRLSDDYFDNLLHFKAIIEDINWITTVNC